MLKKQIKKAMKCSNANLTSSSIMFGTIPPWKTGVASTIAAAVVHVTKVNHKSDLRLKLSSSLRSNDISAPYFISEFWKAGGTTVEINNELIHAYKSNAKLRKTNVAKYDLERTDNHFVNEQKSAVEQVLFGDFNVLRPCSIDNTVIKQDKMKLSKNVSNRSASITNSNLKKRTFYASQKTETLYPIIESFGYRSFWDMPIGNFLSFIGPIVFAVVGTCFVNRVFTGRWIEPKKASDKNDSVLSVVPVKELKQKVQPISTKTTIPLAEQMQPDGSIYYWADYLISPIIKYDVVIKTLFENKLVMITLKHCISKEEGEKALEGLSEYGAFLIKSKS